MGNAQGGKLAILKLDDFTVVSRIIHFELRILRPSELLQSRFAPLPILLFPVPSFEVFILAVCFSILSALCSPSTSCPDEIDLAHHTDFIGLSGRDDA